MWFVVKRMVVSVIQMTLKFPYPLSAVTLKMVCCGLRYLDRHIPVLDELELEIGCSTVVSWNYIGENF